MSEKIEGYLYQEHEPTPDNPCEIKTIVCNDIEIPVEFLEQNFVTVDGKEYIELQQENKQLKEMFEDSKTYGKQFLYKHNKNLLEANERLRQENADLKEKIILLKASEPMLELEKYYGERDKYKEVIEEVREVIRDSHVEVLKYHDEPSEKTSYEIVTVELLQILDKIK